MTTYSDARRAEATALAISLGPSGDKQAAKQYGVPARTIRRWVYLVKQGGQRGEAIVSAETREQVAERFWSVVSRGTERMVDALNDPKTPARDVARIVEVGFTSHSLMAGGPTARTETTARVAGHDEDEEDARHWWANAAGGPLSWSELAFVRESFDHGAYWLYREMVRELRASRAEGREPVAVDPAGSGEFIYDPKKQALEHQTQPEQPSPDAAWHAERARLGDGRNGQ